MVFITCIDALTGSFSAEGISVRLHILILRRAISVTLREPSQIQAPHICKWPPHTEDIYIYLGSSFCIFIHGQTCMQSVTHKTAQQFKNDRGYTCSFESDISATSDYHHTVGLECLCL